MSDQNIILIGPMGSGKSTIGQLIASRLNRDFFDSDYYIEEKTGVNIPTIFDIEGEDGFRARETKALEELTSQKKLVIATGGGSVMRQENQRIMSDGFIIFLDTSVNQQMARLRHDKKRPLLQTDNPREKLEKLFAERKPIYIDLADLRIKTDRKFARKVASEIIPQLPSNLT
ncbi:MAG: shikimate kinase AroK [Gammaproteobacteria bacterium]|jgi:shikimate kinase|nr:shikimate kinase AroK [Gammaproteobacteria bacterium]MBT3722737.1 shikimate kinase AroK [Gammaproteobacteria bacterium]MBT4077689.1 shikimate kinase AroK [Gammaproteobacteria bacterium]MBT4196147.1 shikimate kinase AroK [Gammaproteobacteria bacterium]MBT4448635.1 shikimate kinase AroK [Gammaproteobacteria bacterium]